MRKQGSFIGISQQMGGLITPIAYALIATTYEQLYSSRPFPGDTTALERGQ